MRAFCVALASLFVAGGAEAQERTVTVGDLIGKSPLEAAEGLGLADPAWIPQFVGVDGGAVAIVKANTLNGAACGGPVRLTAAEREWPEAFVFADGRLTAVARPVTPPRRALPAQREILAEIREAQRRPPGPLPLSAGVQAYVAGIAARGFPPETPLRITCLPPLPAASGTASRGPQDPLQLAFGALAIVWFSPYLVTRPFEIADRKSAAKSGGQLLAALRPGEPLPGGEAAFRKQKVVRWHAAPETPDYAVATLDLGGGRAGGARDFVAIGVRAGRVEWIGAPNSHMGLCNDGQGRVSGMRPGCGNGTGFYRP